MKEFKIFEKHIVWTRTKIINFSILLLLTIIIFTSLILKIEKSTFLTFLMWTVFALHFIGRILKFMNFNRIQKLKGRLFGKLIFEKNHIQVNENRINLENIKQIEITGGDWIGLDLRTANYNYENGLSNGIKNYLLIEFNDKTKQKIQFQQNNACEFKDIEEVIKHYYKSNKIGYLNCVDILCLSNKEQWNEFRNINK